MAHDAEAASRPFRVVEREPSKLTISLAANRAQPAECPLPVGDLGRQPARRTRMPSTRWPAFAKALLALSPFLGGCEGAEPSRRAEPPRVIETVSARCNVGGRPAYFVPADSPAVVLGCARLGVSGKWVEFSGSLSRIDGERELCINPAYSGRGQRGFFIPSLCKLEPPPPRFAIRGASQPRQGVRGYGHVVWGTAPPGTSHVVARFNSGRARAAVFHVPSRRAFGERPFDLFVVELPRAAACRPISVRAMVSHRCYTWARADQASPPRHHRDARRPGCPG